MFIGICNEENHRQELKYFCKDHNKLCCAACIAKINKKGDGQHKDCNICCIEDIKEEKKNGIEINKINKKKVHITFVDNIPNSKRLVEEIPILSYKNYNFINYINKDENNNKCGVCCFIF